MDPNFMRRGYTRPGRRAAAEPSDPALEELLQRFDRESLEPDGISELRRKEQLRTLRAFAKKLPYPLTEMTPRDLSEYVGGEIKRGVHPRTVVKYLAFFRSFVRWAEPAGLIDLERAIKLKSVRNPRGGATIAKPRPYTAEEVREFYAALAARYPRLPARGTGSGALHAFKRNRAKGKNPRLDRYLHRHARRLQYEALVALALEAGMRRQEMFNLSIPAMHPDNDQLVVLTAKQGPGAQVRRTIPYTAHARKAVGEWLALRKILAPDHDRPWLMLDVWGDYAYQTRPLGIRVLHDTLNQQIGPGWCWHRFRHTAATEWLRAGVPLEKVRIYMGHSNINITLMYVQILASDVDSAFHAAEAAFSKRLGLDSDEEAA